MAKSSEHFFNLGNAATLSRRLVEGPSLVEASQIKKRDSQVSLDLKVEELISQSENRIELWDGLIKWAREKLEADGVFSLDQNGFVISANSMDGTIPAEVLSATFSEGKNLLDPYLTEDGEVHTLEIGITKMGWISIAERETLGFRVLLCVWSRRRQQSRKLERVWSQLLQAVANHDLEQRMTMDADQ